MDKRANVTRIGGNFQLSFRKKYSFLFDFPIPQEYILILYGTDWKLYRKSTKSGEPTWIQTF